MCIVLEFIRCFVNWLATINGNISRL